MAVPRGQVLVTMSRLFGVLLLAWAASAQRPFKTNKMIDDTLAWHNDLLTRLDYGLVNLPRLELGWITLENGVQVGMNSLYRTGDCYAWRVGTNSVLYSNQIGYRLLAFAFGKITTDKGTVSGILRVSENSLQFDYTVHNDTGECRVSLDQYQFVEFGDLELVSSSPEHPELEVSAELFGGEDELLTLVNGLIGPDRTALEQHLQPLCSRPLPPLPPPV